MKFKDENGDEWEGDARMCGRSHCGIGFGGEVVIRKLPKPDPMPEILPGDVIEYDGIKRVVFRAESDSGFMRYTEPDGLQNSWGSKYFEKHSDSKLYRNGKLLWKRNN